MPGGFVKPPVELELTLTNIIAPARKCAIIANLLRPPIVRGAMLHTQQRGLSMLKTLRVAAAFAASIGLASALATPAAAQGGVNVGNLTCSVASGWGFVFGSSRSLNCTFAGMGGRYEYYAGNIAKFGVDIGYTQGGVLIWTVVAPTANPGTGRSRRQLRRSHRQRHGRRRRRGQCADRRLRQHDRAAAAQHRRQSRPQRCRRDRSDQPDPGPVSPTSRTPSEEVTLTIGVAHLQPIVALIAGVLILLMPRILNYVVAIYLIVTGIIGLGLVK